MTTVDLGGTWTLRRKGDPRFGAVPCAVPGGVLAEIGRASVILLGRDGGTITNINNNFLFRHNKLP